MSTRFKRARQRQLAREEQYLLKRIREVQEAQRLLVRSVVQDALKALEEQNAEHHDSGID